MVTAAVMAGAWHDFSVPRGRGPVVVVGRHDGRGPGADRAADQQRGDHQGDAVFGDPPGSRPRTPPA